MIHTDITQTLSRDHSLESNKRYSRHRNRSESRSRRSRSRSTSYHRSRSRSNRRSRHSRARTPATYSRSHRSRPNPRDDPERFNPPRNDILAVFGLDRDASENDLFNFFKKYGCKRCKVIFDKRTGKPRGFGFVYFDNIEDASRAKRATNGRRLLTRELRVDYSIGEKDYSSAKSSSYHTSYGYHSNSRPSYLSSRYDTNYSGSSYYGYS
ncbi:unnamed protein product [Brachionus calyciflorus]|uniref:RRM domain-containing protein n=1 Tax=Brachionus calyciflorus TaxID=104777 RepID=A0A813ZLL9_9BILA|nr:unnamed protein product [Brachionus calyciflorus]